MNTQSEAVINYHNRTKHHLERYAKGPETIDWDDQPDPFRRFADCDLVSLPMPGAEVSPLYAELSTPGLIPAQPVTHASLGLLLELALGLSAWKQFGPSRWALRCNPSSGNLHPTEAYLIITHAELMKSGVYHYVSHDHQLERRCEFTESLASAELFIGLSSIHWREAWKYGERAFRYCQHDLGHALACLRYAAATLGWSIEVCTEVGDDELAIILGLNRSQDFVALEHEAPDVLCRVYTQSDDKPLDYHALVSLAHTGHWQGKAYSLRAYHFYKWPVIDDVCHAAKKWSTPKVTHSPMPMAMLPSSCEKSAAEIIRTRRSAQHFNKQVSPMRQDSFFRILSAVLPSAPVPFDSWPWSPCVNLLLFVHNVEGVEAGLYALVRQPQHLAGLKAAMLSDFSWQSVHATLPFYQLVVGDFRMLAKKLSCHQAIASDSAFSLAMVAEFADVVAEHAWAYRRLFWECGMIGQVLYLEAEAEAWRGTGIGCYFDDAVHQVLGLTDNRFQSLYHFTVGIPLEDQRLQTLPAYAHLS